MAHCKAHQLDMHGFCAKFDCPCIQHNCRFFGVKTNADHFREAISTEEGLAKFLMRVHDEGIYIPFCQKKEECWGLIEENGVPDEKCMECLKEWLRKPYEGDCV
jgi:hypothetical protein